jgi:hypothetical protein
VEARALSVRDECVEINSEIPSGVFVGAAATLAHLGWRARRTSDLDIAVEVISEVEEQRLIDLQYRKIGNKWYTPRGWKIDIYRRDVGGFSITQIASDSVQVTVKKSQIRVANLEMLILMKHRAGQTEDVRNLVGNKFSSINWNYLQSIAHDDVEVQEMKNVARSLQLMK